MLMAVMMTPREKWTDEGLDDLNRKVDLGLPGWTRVSGTSSRGSMP
jgi:hypothetical protein